MEQYEEMSASCKRALTTANRYLVDGVLKIDEGRFVVNDSSGAQIDLSTPAFGSVQEIAVKAGFEVSNTGVIQTTSAHPPMVVCARARRFDDALASIGVESRGEESPEFAAALAGAGLAASPK